MRATRARVFKSLAVIALFAAMPAHAAEPGFYVGFLYGDSSKDFDVEQFSDLSLLFYADINHLPESRDYTTREDGESYGFLAGYRLTQHIAFEAGYLYLGKQQYRETSRGFFDPGDPAEDVVPEELGSSLTSRTKGFTLAAMGVLPISYSWELYGRAGVLIATNELSSYINGAGFAGPQRYRISESSTDWLAGAGVSFSLAEVYALRAEFTRIFDAGEDVFGEADADLVSIGVTVAF